jgi:hypothetical protein
LTPFAYEFESDGLVRDAFNRHWSRTPTGAEFLIETIVAINVGAKGSVSWNDPTTPEIKASASAFAKALPELTPFLLSSQLTYPPVNFTHIVTPDRLDFGVWASADGRALVIGANLNNATASIPASEVISPAKLSVTGLGSPRVVLDGGSRIDDLQIWFDNLGSGAWIFEYTNTTECLGAMTPPGWCLGSLEESVMTVLHS